MPTCDPFSFLLWIPILRCADALKILIASSSSMHLLAKGYADEVAVPIPSDQHVFGHFQCGGWSTPPVFPVSRNTFQFLVCYFIFVCHLGEGMYGTFGKPSKRPVQACMGYGRVGGCQQKLFSWHRRPALLALPFALLPCITLLLHALPFLHPFCSLLP